jgi:Polysaccharide deacetylase
MNPITILLYHRFAETDGPDTTAVGVFREHLRLLAGEGWQPLTVAQFVAAVESGSDPGPRRFVFTLDDGREEVLRVVDDLVRHEIDVLSFLVTSQTGSDGCHGWDVARTLRRDARFSFASHSHRHARWPMTEEGRQVLAADLIASRRHLRDELGPGPLDSHLAWPWGRCDAAFEDEARRQGFDWQYIVQRCAVDRPGRTLRLPRICMDGVPPSRFRLILNAMASPATAAVARNVTGAVRRWRHGLAY